MSGYAGTGQLVRLALRRDRVRIPVWVVSVAAITYLTAVSEEGLYTSQAAIDAYAALSESSPVAIAFAGPPIGLHTLPGIVVYEMSLMAILGVSLMSVFMVSRHSRAEEESGRSEMLRATEVGRHAGGAAALLATALACLLMGLGVWLALLPSVLPDDAAFVFGAEVALLGLVFAGITLCLAQLFVHARTVSGAGLMTFGVAYVVRAAGDIRGDWLVWLSPIGWVQATHVPTENRWWPLLVPLVACALLLVLAVVLAERRDFGGGMVPTRAGLARAPRTLSGTVGLAWRTQRGALLGWVVGMLLLGAVTGVLSQSMEDMVKDNPQMADYLEIVSGDSVVDAYLAAVVLIFALTAAGFAVWSAGHPGADEDEAQLDLLLATPLSRTRSLLGNLAVTLVNTVLVLLAVAVGVGVAHGIAVADSGQAWRLIGAMFAYLPAIATLVGLVVLVAGWVPRWTWVGWVVLAFSFVIGWLGGLLDPPDWVRDLSPFSHIPYVPVESAASRGPAVLAVVAALLVFGGLVGFHRRDVGVG
jgi:ABC-2 type transport system permease protein